MRLPALLPFLLAPVVLLGLGTGSGGVVAPGAPDPLDSARAEMEIGRHWHAARILRDALQREGLEPEGLLLLARAEAGYLNWGGVREVLEGAAWLDDVEGGRGWGLLARALEAEAGWSDAAAAWERYLASPHGTVDPERAALRVRLARARSRLDDGPDGAAVADSLAAAGRPLGSWFALELAPEAAERGDTGSVRALREAMRDPVTRRRSWELPARAHLEAGDSAGAETAYRAALDSLTSGSARSRAWGAVGAFRLRAADTTAAREAFLEALDADPRGASAVAAADRLLALGALTDAGRALQAGRTLARGGEHRRALEAYDLHEELSASALSPVERLDRARLLSLIPGRHGDAIEEFRALDDAIEDDGAGLRNLALWMDLRRRQGRTGDVATIQGWILERHPASAEAVEVVFFRGDAAQDRGALDEAVTHYGRLQRMNSSLDRSGLARMRMAQIHLGRGATDEALAVYRGYLDEYPEGRRWDEATYWSGRILLESGSPAADSLLRSIGARDPLSYYAVQAAALLDEPYRLRLPGDAVPEPLPAELARDLEDADLLAAAGLDEGRAVVLDALEDRALEAGAGVALTFARALLERGLAIDAVNLAWAVRQRGTPWSRALLEAAYPFPYREMVRRAARERGVDPMRVAALIRQESAFDPDIVSVAGAVGLMQVMPPTGRELARREGPTEFSVASLEAPEINLHLGTRFFRDMWDRYDGEWTLVLSAYNAGPTRASRWRSYPEVSDPLRFTERIPFRETRDYVKQVTRNVALYEALYGEG